MQLVLASGNPGKVDELRELLRDAAFELRAQSHYGVVDVEETATTFVENALLKARHAARETGLPAMADDSGLCVDALGGEPGLYSARYGGVQGDAGRNIARLLDAMHGVPVSDRAARFYCVIVVLRSPDDPQPLIAEGEWQGRILEAPRGAGGFGYDPVFFDPAHDCSAAELDPSLKNRISHRGRALAALKPRLDTWLQAQR
ncbi:MAG TPA: RdgB/HAM1 family non-canonical purine NTP pyrophosphatase [Luteimonas sp.]|nr:RdgB/HAM1 family non-canonical purine NTP pyrophosphatase [Luteimonas sp.]